MKKLFIAVLALSFLSTGVVFAQDMGQGQGQDQGRRVGQQKTPVMVTEFNEMESSLTYTTEDGSTYQIPVTDDAEITGPAGETMTTADIQPGMQVEITFTGSKVNQKISKINITEMADTTDGMTEPTPEQPMY